MRPDTHKEQQQGWIVLGVAFVLCLGVAGWYAQDDGLSTRVQGAAQKQAGHKGTELMAEHIESQVHANQILAQSIGELKTHTAFQLAPFFTITPDERRETGFKDGEIWLRRQFSPIAGELEDRAKDFSLKDWQRDQSLGFNEALVPPDNEVTLYSKVLQITYRIATICFSVPPNSGVDHIHSLQISHGTQIRTLPQKVAPAGRPLLMIEYPISVTVSGPLTDIDYILYRFTNPEEFPKPDDPDLKLDPGKYPLVLKHCTILCNPSVANEPPAPVPAALDVTATMVVAAIEFVPDAERGVTTTTSYAGGGSSGHAPASTSRFRP